MAPTPRALTVGIAFDLRQDYEALAQGGPDDRLEEYDAESTVQAIAAAIAQAGHRPVLLGNGERLLRALMAPGPRPDLVFNFAEGFGTRSREAHVPALLELLRVPFTHSDPLALAVSLEKAMCKRLVGSFGVPTPRFAVIERVQDLERLELAFPLIAKPLWEGSSMGIRSTSRVDDAAALEREVRRQLEDYGEPVLVEEFASGPEFTVGITGTGAAARLIGVMEIQPVAGAADDFVYSLEVKRNFERDVRYVAPPARPAEMVNAVAEVALAAYRALGCRDLGRVDVRLGKDGTPYFLELNPIPGLDPHKSDVVILARRMGLTYEQLIAGVVDSARARYGL